MHGDLVLQTVIDRETRIFARRSQPGFPSRIMNVLLRRPLVDSIVIVQRMAADPDSLRCAGEAVRSWLLDASGLKEIPTQPEMTGDGNGRYWHRQLVNFFVSDDGQTIILNEMEGPKDGTFLFAIPAQRGEKVVLKVKRARVILNGHAIS